MRYRYGLRLSTSKQSHREQLLFQQDSMMWAQFVLLLSCILDVTSEDPVLYYYGLDESERSLPLCGARQACAAVLERYWRAPALLRLCRCARRARCDAPAPPARRRQLNNRAYFQFCKPVDDWPVCSVDDIPLTVESPYDRFDPEEIEELHHKNIQLQPPKITFKCRCRNSRYWKLQRNSTMESEGVKTYQCASLPYCRTGEFCGNVSGNLYALYQSCLCPMRHICVHGGGLPRDNITELLYSGNGWRAHCVRVGKEESYEDEEYD